MIDSPGVLISSSADASIGALYLEYNRKVKFLPENPAESFPDLVVYNAGYCSIETITKENFKGLSKIIKIFLQSNKITKVPNDVFEDLSVMEGLWLGE